MIYKIILYIIIILIIYYLGIKIKNAIYNEEHIEKFTDKLDYSIDNVLNEFKEKDDDIFDKEYVNLYDIAYYDFFDINRDNKVISKYGLGIDLDKNKNKN